MLVPIKINIQRMKMGFLFLGFFLTLIIGCQGKSEIINGYINPNLIIDSRNINNDTDTILYSDHGSIIRIPEKCFQFLNGKGVSGDVKIIIQEAHYVSDFIHGKLTTVSNGKIIQSGGMINILAFKDSIKLELRSEKTIEISMPRYGAEIDWVLFKGEVDLNNKSYNWNILPDKIKSSYIDTIVQIDTMYYSQTNYDLKINYYVFECNQTDSAFIDTFTIVADEKVDIESNLFKSKIVPLLRNVGNLKFQDNSSTTYYNFKISKLGWVNIDRFLNDSEVVEMKLDAKIDDKTKYDQENVYLIFLKRNIYIEAFKTNNGLYVFSEELESIVKLPKGDKVLVVLECYLNGQCYYDIEKFELNNENNIILKPKKLETQKLNDLIAKEL